MEDRRSPKALGDSHDTEAIEAAANRAVELSGSGSRFIPIATGDQTVNWVFGKPEQWDQIAKDFVLPSVHGKPADQGREFERQVGEMIMRREVGN
jgi:hypothetical protein